MLKDSWNLISISLTGLIIFFLEAFCIYFDIKSNLDKILEYHIQNNQHTNLLSYLVQLPPTQQPETLDNCNVKIT